MSRLLPAVVVLVPLLIAPGLTLNYDVIPRLALFQLALAAMLLCWRSWLPGIRQLAAGRHGRVFLVLNAAAAVWIVVTAATSADRRISFYGSNWRALGAITWVSIVAFGLITAGALVHSPQLIRRLLRAVAISGIAGALYGILQYFGIDPLLPGAAYHDGDGVFRIVRPPGTLGHADYFALWLVSIFFLSTALTRDTRSSWRWVGHAAQMTSGLAILLSGTRSSILALIAGAIALAIMLRPRVAIRDVSAFSIPVLVGVVLFFSPAGASLRARVHWSMDEPVGGARLLLWRDSLHMAAARPISGYGPEEYSSVFPRFQSVDLARRYPDWYHESPHNALLDAATSSGIPALVLTLALFAAGLLAASRARASHPHLAAVLFAGIVAQAVNLQFVSLTVSSAVFLFLFLALAVSIAPSSRRAAPAESGRWVFVPALAAAVALAILAVRLLATDVLLERFDRAVAEGRTAAAFASYENAHRWSPSGAASDLYCSRRLLAAAFHSPAIAPRMEISHDAILAAANAVRLADDRQNAWYNLALISAAEGDSRNVERCLREALTISPNWFKPHWMLARLLNLENRGEEARTEASTALSLDGGHDPEVARTLTQVGSTALAAR